MPLVAETQERWNIVGRTTITFDASNSDLLTLIHRAEKWLKENSFSNPILKWETKAWGEIPADFGRK